MSERATPRPGRSGLVALRIALVLCTAWAVQGFDPGGREAVQDSGSPPLKRWATLSRLAGQVPATAQPAQTDARRHTQQRLSSLLTKLPKHTQVGLVVADADSGSIWFAHQPDTLLKPASLQKLLVAAAALERFGPGFGYQTRVYLHGDELWVVGAGDPGLGDERVATRHGRQSDHVFQEWAAALRTRGVSSLSKIVLDDTVFEQPGRHPDWPDDQADRWYEAPVGGLNFNDNCLDVSVIVRGREIELRLQPDLPAGLVDSKLAVGARQRPIVKRAPTSDVFELHGTVTRSGTLDPVSAREPTVFFGHALQRALARHGIEVRGEVISRRLSAEKLSGAALLATHTTGLPDVLWRCNAFSQNLFAECLLKSLAAYEPGGRRSARPGSWDAGRGVLKVTLADLGLDLTTAIIRDGSGLSHSNRLTAAQITRLLILMRRHRHADVFLGSLAVPGEPGSLERRHADPVLRGRLRGKTGTIRGVRCLAGYLTRRDHTVLAFGLLINGKSDATFARQLCRILLDADGPP